MQSAQTSSPPVESAGPTPDFVTPALVHRACDGCGKTLEPSSPGGFWLVDTRPYHPACAPWRGRPMPYTWARDRGRKLLASLHRHKTRPSEKLVRAVNFLDELARAWPVEDVAGALERAELAAVVVEHWAVAAKSSRERKTGYAHAAVWPYASAK